MREIDFSDVIALFTLVLTILSFIYHEIRRNSVSEHTAKLDYRVNQLTTRMSETLEWLHRTSELTRRFHQLVVEMNNSRVIKLEHQSELVAIQMEFEVLVEMIDDEQLSDLVGKLKVAQGEIQSNLTEQLHIKDVPKQIEILNQITSAVKQIHQRVYELIKEQKSRI